MQLQSHPQHGLSSPLLLCSWPPTVIWSLQVFKIKTRSYIPDFKLAFEHFCLHTGGRGVIEEIEKQLQLAPNHVQASKDTLWRYGNTSSSSIWWASMKSQGIIRKGLLSGA